MLSLFNENNHFTEQFIIRIFENSKILQSNRYIFAFLEIQKFGITDFCPKIAHHRHLNN